MSVSPRCANLAPNSNRRPLPLLILRRLVGVANNHQGWGE
jgi:hypothetical protein